MAKYSIVKGKSGKAKKVIVAGVKKVLYKKKGSMSMYVISKKRHIKLSKYKKMKMKVKGGEGQTGGKRNKSRKKKGGVFRALLSNFLNKNQKQQEQQEQQGGGRKKKRGKKRRSKK